VVNEFFSNKVVLITGGGSGLGRASAVAFAQEGVRVAVADVNEAGGRESVDLVQKAGGEAFFISCDVTDQAQVGAMVQATVDAYGQLDFALNSAGISGPMSLTAEYDDELWHRVLDINLNGLWYCMKDEINYMLTQGHGSIVNIASVAGLIGAPRLSAYVASKHAVVGLTKTAALEYVRQGIRINAVCPGFTDTPMVQEGIVTDPIFGQQLINGIPARRLGRPEEVAAAVVYLCSEQAGFIVGHSLTLDGGISAG